MPNFNKAEGTLAFGVNGLEAYFSQVKQSVLSPPVKPVEIKTEAPKPVAKDNGPPTDMPVEEQESEEIEKIEEGHEKIEEIED